MSVQKLKQDPEWMKKKPKPKKVVTEEGEDD